MMNSWLVTPMGLVGVTSRYRFRAVSSVKDLALVAVMHL